MNEEIEIYFKDLLEKYGDSNISITPSDIDDEKLK